MAAALIPYRASNLAPAGNAGPGGANRVALVDGRGCAGCGSRDTLTDGKEQTTTWERDVQGG